MSITKSEIITLPLDKLHVSPFNMRAEKKQPSLARMAEIAATILPSVREKGVQTPVLIRPNNQDFEIVAGRRRFYASLVKAAETKQPITLRCDLRPDMTDVEALEMSAIENMERESPDPITEYETFAGLIRLGRTVAEIAKTFGKEKKVVERRLAIADLMPQIRDLYRAEKINREDLEALTLASKKQQREWLRLVDQKKAPHGVRLKDWLFGGDTISTKVALFDLSAYPGETTKDLFNEQTYFTDADLFWQHQAEAVAARRDAYLAEGWSEVVVIERGKHFYSGEMTKAKKKDGARVYIECRNTGEVNFHEGYLTFREVQKLQKAKEAEKKGAKGEAEAVEKTARSPITQAMQAYLDQHRLAVVRLAVMKQPKHALRLMIAHAIAASGNWSVRPDPQHSPFKPVHESVAASPAQAAFAAEAKKVRALLAPAFKGADMDDEDSEVSGRVNRDGAFTFKVFQRLLKLSHAEVARIAAFVMAETLAASSEVVNGFGAFAKIETRKHWSPDAVFFDLLRDRATINGMVAEIEGKKLADKMVTAKLKEQKDALAAAAAKAPAWCPGWMRFPATGL